MAVDNIILILMLSIELKDAYFRYIRTAFELRISLTVDKGEFVAIVGPNGSGKTTLLRLIAGVYKPQQGLLLINGRPLHSRGDVMTAPYSRRDLAKVVGFVPQEHRFAFDFTVEQIVMMGRYPYLGRFRLPAPDDFASVRAALEFTDTWRLRNRLIGQLSGGERQLVSLARALAQRPEILLLDEPLSQLDLAHQWQMLQLLKKLHDQQVTIILVSHDINLASSTSSRMLMLRDGRIIAQGSPGEVVTEELIRQLYAVNLIVRKHPRTQRPQVLFDIE